MGTANDNEFNRRVAELQEIQKRNHPSSDAWKKAHEDLRKLVLEVKGVDIDGPASWKK